MELKLEKLKLQNANIDSILYYIKKLFSLILKIYFKIEKKKKRKKKRRNKRLIKLNIYLFPYKFRNNKNMRA